MKYLLALIGILAIVLLGGTTYGTSFEESQVSYTRDVKPIFTKNCMSCHNPKSGLGNWQEYKQAYDKRVEIKTRVESREMPVHGGTRMSESDIINLYH